MDCDKGTQAIIGLKLAHIVHTIDIRMNFRRMKLNRKYIRWLKGVLQLWVISKLK